MGLLVSFIFSRPERERGKGRREEMDWEGEDREMIKNYILYSLSFFLTLKHKYAFAYTFVFAFSCWID